MPGTLAQVIQGEAGSDPANQFAVASTIYNRAQLGTFPGGSDPTAIVNAPQQYTGYSASPNASAQTFAQAIQSGTLGNYGNTGNAVNFMSGSAAANNGLTAGGANIGGNFFSDNLGPPTKNFTAPSFVPDQFSVSTTPGSQSSTLIQDPGGATNANGDSFTFNSPTEATPSGVSQNSNTLVDPFTGTFIDPTTGAQDTGAIGNILSGAGALGTSGLSLPGTTAASGTTSPDQATAGTDFFTNAFNDVWNLAQRGGLIILGIVLIAVAAFWLASGQGRAVLQRIRP